VIGQSGDIWTEIVGGGFNSPIAGTYALNKTTGASSGASITLSGGLGHGLMPSANLDVFESAFRLGNTGSPVTVTLSGLGAGTMIDLYLYAAGGHAAGEPSIFNFGSVQATTDTNVNETSYELGVNYVKFSSLVADASGNISGTWSRPGASHSSFNGLQFQVVPEPSTALLGGLGGLGFLALLRRRR